MTAKTDNLEDFLKYYLSLKAPGYAVLVTGEWGSGKTYRVKELIPESERYYTSLYGITSPEQVHAELYASAFPRRTKTENLIKKVSTILSSIGGNMALAKSVPLFLGSIVKKKLKKEKVLVFDDVERCDTKIQAVLGIINGYVEHEGFKAIIILHDGKTEETFAQRKEKIIGQTLRIEPNYHGAFENFKRHLRSERAASFIEKYRSAIINNYLMSEKKSLRILRHTMLDLERLHGVLCPRHLQHEEAMQELVELCTVISLEAKAGSISKEDLISIEQDYIAYRVNAYVRKASETEKTKTMTTLEKYLIKIPGKVINIECLSAMFFDGEFSKTSIRHSIDNSPSFSEQNNTQPWKVIINFDYLEDSAVVKAIEDMDKMLLNKEITSIGEILHSFALKMLLVNKSIVEGTLENVKAEALGYITELCDLNMLDPWYKEDAHFMRTGHEHISYWVEEEYSDFFSQIKEHIRTERERAFESHAYEVHDEIFDLMHSNVERLIELIAHTNSHNGCYADYPVFKNMAAQNFVDHWLSAPLKNWQQISLALSCRYYHHALENQLSEEKPWATQVADLMLYRSQIEEGLNRLRIYRAIPDTLKNLATDHKEPN